jgi:CAAX protease family protein
MAEGDRWPTDGSGTNSTSPDLRLVEENPSPEAHVPWSPPEPTFPYWTIWDVVVIPGVTVLAIFLCSAVALLIAHSIPAFHKLSFGTLAQEPLIVVGSQIASYPLVIAFMAGIVRRRSNLPFLIAIHWKWPKHSAILFYLSGFVLAFTVEGLAHFLPIPKSLPMDKFFNDATSAYLMAFFGILVAPVLEELFFRGMLYPTLRRAMGVVPGLILTAAAFAAIHGAQLGYAWAPIMSIFVVGLALTVVRQFTDSVAAGVLMHSGYNSTLFALLWFGSEHFHHLEKLGS